MGVFSRNRNGQSCKRELVLSCVKDDVAEATVVAEPLPSPGLAECGCLFPESWHVKTLEIVGCGVGLQQRCRVRSRLDIDQWEVSMDGITQYRVTDLQLHTTDDLMELATALEAQGMRVSHRELKIAEESQEFYRIAETDRMWVFQLSCCDTYEAPEPEVAALLSIVESLDPRMRAVWNRCTRRFFDLGYDCGITPFSVRHEFSAETLSRIAAVGGELRITLYALDPSEIQSSEPDAATSDGNV